MTNDDVFSFSLPTKGITDQENTGRCWMFAGLNMMRQGVIKQYKLEDFELVAELHRLLRQLEKANVFSNSSSRRATATCLTAKWITCSKTRSRRRLLGLRRSILSRNTAWCRRNSWGNASSSDTERMDGILTSLLRRDASRAAQNGRRRKSACRNCATRK